MGRRKQSGETITLFPFLSILAGTIGILVLMIVAAVLASASKADAESEAEQAAAEQRLEEYKQLKAQHEADNKEIERLQQLMEQADKIREELKQKRAELERLKTEQAEQLKTNEEIAKLLAELEVLKERIAELEKSLEEIEKEIARLLEELKKRKIPPPPAKVQIRPSGSAEDLKPTFVECNPRGIVIYQGPDRLRIAHGDIMGNKKYLELLQDVGDSEDRRLVFLVRSGGINTFNTASRRAKIERARHGKMPVPGEGELDLSLFQSVN